jgi:hypothetical protein
MENHPIPQQISSYQFRLVGDMTLKQFFQLAGGLLVSLLFYASPLPGFVKWPLIIFFALLGVALAFLPFEERPLSRWIIEFFRAIYSPTIFSWQRTTSTPIFFQEEGVPTPVPMGKIIAPGGEAALQKYLTVTPEERGSILSKLEQEENSFLSKLSSLFTSTFAPAPAPTSTSAAPIFTPQKGAFTIPTNVPTKIVVEEKPQPAPQVAKEVQFTPIAPVVTGDRVTGVAAQFSMEAAPPNPPTTPNIIVGQVLGANGKIIEGAIMEIRDIAGRPVRALKTNKLGHFMIVTPLMNGQYEIITEKEGLIFEPITFEAKGEISPPIAIKGRSQTKVVVEEKPTNVN